MDNIFVSGRTDPLDRSVRFIKPIYSSYVNLLDITLSDTPSSHHSAQSENSPAPLQEVLDILGINQIDCNNIEVENEDLIIYQTPPVEEDNVSEHSFASATTIDIDDIIEDNIRNDDQLLIDFGHPRLIDNPRDVWCTCVSDLPPSPNQTRSTSSEESLTSTERRRRQEQQQSDRDTEFDTTTTSPGSPSSCGRLSSWWAKKQN